MFLRVSAAAGPDGLLEPGAPPDANVAPIWLMLPGPALADADVLARGGGEAGTGGLPKVFAIGAAFIAFVKLSF